jgi:hypothetical protein
MTDDFARHLDGWDDELNDWTDATSTGWDFPADLLEAAWGLIANANEGDWDKAHPDWKAAAERWRDAYHASLPPLPPAEVKS